MDDGTDRQGSWDCGRERQAAGQARTPPQIHSRDRCGFIYLNGCLMISRPRLCVLRPVAALLKNRSFVWRRAVDTPGSALL